MTEKQIVITELDRQRLIEDVDRALQQAERLPGFLDEVPAYEEEYY